MQKVARLPINVGVSGWNAILEAPAPAVQLKADVDADYAIVGGGFAGLAAARRLHQLQPEARIVLLEANRIGEGPAGRNSGFMVDLPHDLTSNDYSTTHENDLKQIRLNRQAIEFAAQMAAEYELPQEAFDQCGKVNGAAHDKAIAYNETYAAHLKSLGEKFEMLDAAAMKRLTGSDFYKSGLRAPGTAVIQPAQYVRGLAKGLGKDVSIFENSAVTAFHYDDGKWELETAKGRVHAAKVILATNGHVESFGHFKRKLVHIMLFGSMTRALSAEEAALTGEARWGITPSEPAATTMRKIDGIGGTRIITRNCISYSPELSVPNSRLDSVKPVHEASFLRRYPELAHVEQEYTWAGRLCLSRNGVSAFGEIAPGLYSACCQNGLGVARGTLSGMAVAELVFGEITERVEAFLAEESLLGLPPKPLDRIGAPIVMRWAEFRARKEF